MKKEERKLKRFLPKPINLQFIWLYAVIVFFVLGAVMFFFKRF